MDASLSRVMPIALRASQTLDMRELLDLCAEGASALLAPESAHVYLPSAVTGDLRLHASWIGTHRPTRRPPPVLDADLLSSAAAAGTVTDGAGLRLGASPWGHGAEETIALVPLVESGRSTALVLAVGGTHHPGFGAEMLQAVRAFLDMISPAVQNVRLVTELKETAVRDDLAGCYNRRHFESFLAEEVSRAQRFGTRVSILFLDMDDLKGVNTRFGHAMGSRTLQEVSERIDNGIRKIDKLFRFGGDEFCVVLPETDARGARKVAERTREAIASAPLLVPEVGGVGLSASVGIATYPDHAVTSESLVQAADRAMQHIKSRGKNAIGIAEPHADAPPGIGIRT